MRVYVYPADTTGCGQYRLIMPAQALRAQGYDVTIEWPSARTGIHGHLDGHGNVVDVTVPPDADVIVMQRLSHLRLAQAVPLIRAQGVAVVVDMDDDLSCIHPANPAYARYHPRTGELHSWRHAADACRDATLVTTSSPALHRTYAAHGRGVVLHNHIPAAYLNIERVDSDVIGWGGSLHSHPDDLQTTGIAIGRLVSEGHPFKVVGPVDGIRTALRLDADPLSTGPVDMTMWPHALATLGVGIAPLADTRFNAAKSWLKPLEMAAVGVPWVASPRAEYAALHNLGVGTLANKPQHWYTRLRGLVTSASLREEMSQQGRAVAAEHTIEGNAWRWWEAWEHAYQLQHSHAAMAGART